MNRSEAINELATALAKAQSEIEGALKGANNPAFRSKYADLGAVWDAIREPFSKHGLSVAQFPRAVENGVEVETMLMHASGQWLSDAFWIPVSKGDAHGYMSATTYARRGALSAIAGVAPVDDDGNAATGRKDDGSPDADAKPTHAPQRAAARSASPPAAKPAEQRHGGIDKATRNGAAEKWAEQFTAKMKACRSVEERRALWDVSAKYLDRLENSAPDLHTKLLDAYGEMQDAGRSVVEAG